MMLEVVVEGAAATVGGGERIFSFPIIIFFSPGYLLVE
jgi:hypothetical protein